MAEDNTEFRQRYIRMGLTDSTCCVLERMAVTPSLFGELNEKDIEEEEVLKKLPLRNKLCLRKASKKQNKNEKPEELRIVLVGKTGSGKSSTGNTILNKTRDDGGFFSQGGPTEAVTVQCKKKSVQIEGRNIQVIDTPGVFDPKRDWDDVTHEIVRSLRLCAPGPHALLFVVNASDRFTQEDYNAYYKLKAMFGHHINKYIIIAFTRGDELARDGLTLDGVLAKIEEDAQHTEHLRKSKLETVPGLEEILRDVDNRTILFDNKADSGKKAETVFELLNLIVEMVINNGDQPCYEDETKKKVWEETEKELERIMAEKHATKAEAMKIHKENLKSRALVRKVVTTISASAGGVAAAGGAFLLGTTLAPAAVAAVGGAVVAGRAAYATKKVWSLT